MVRARLTALLWCRQASRVGHITSYVPPSNAGPVVIGPSSYGLSALYRLRFESTGGGLPVPALLASIPARQRPRGPRQARALSRLWHHASGR